MFTSYTDRAGVDGTGTEASNTVTGASGHVNVYTDEVLAATRRPRPPSGSRLGSSLLERRVASDPLVALHSSRTWASHLGSIVEQPSVI